MAIIDRIFGIDKKVNERLAMEKAELQADMGKRIEETELRMMEVSEQKAQGKAQELFEIWRTDLVKAEKEKYDTEAKSYLYDPFYLLEAIGYKERVMSMSYDTLRLMSERNAVVAAIINTRIHQVTAFARPPRSKYDIGFELAMRDIEAEPTDVDKRQMKELSSMLMATGYPAVVDEESRDSFETFLSKIVRDSLTFDQACWEMVNGRGSYPVAFYAVDGSSMRHASTMDTLRRMSNYTKEQLEEMWIRNMQQVNAQVPDRSRLAPPEKIRYVQVINSRVVNTYTEQEMAFGIRNPRTHLQQNNYGISELEILTQVVTSHLWAEEYNRRFFCLLISDSYISTSKGIYKLSDLINGKYFEIWNGNEFVKAKAFETGIKPLVRTKLWNGLELKTSPEHRFYVLENYEPIWKEQKDLKHGDYILVNYNYPDFYSNTDKNLLLKSDYAFRERSKIEKSRWSGKPYLRRPNWNCKDAEVKYWSPTEEMINDPEFWKMIGFALCDGYWGELDLEIFPHHTKDKDILERFKEICLKYKIEFEECICNPSHQRVTDGVFGYPYLHIYNEGFINWLYDLGFKPSSEDRRIPDIFFQLSSWIRCSLLCGMFSADGHSSKQVKKDKTIFKTPTVYSSVPIFVQDILKLLWSVGVASNEEGKGWNRKGNIIVQDVGAFVEKIGYLQDYKNEGLDRTSKSKYKWDRLYPILAKKLALEIIESETYKKSNGIKTNQFGCKTTDKINNKDKDMLIKVSRGLSNISRGRIIEIMDKLEMGVPWWLRAFVQVPADVLDKEPIGYEPMGDIEVFDDKHIFLANGVAVHNSSGSAPKGFISFDISGGGGMHQAQLNAFRRQWHAQVAGVWNAWKTPIIAIPGKMQYQNLQLGNRQMEFGLWIEYLVKLLCALYLIDPAEINFEIKGSTTGQTPQFYSVSEAKLKMSKDRGLQPLLRFVESEINKNLIWRINPKFEFRFVGMDSKTEKDMVDLKIKELQNWKTVDEIRKADDLDPLGEEKGGNLILNPQYVQWTIQNKQMQQMQQMQGGGEPGQQAEQGFDYGTEGKGPEEGGGPKEESAATLTSSHPSTEEIDKIISQMRGGK